MALVAKSAGQEAYEEAEYCESIGRLLAAVSLLPSDFIGLEGAAMEAEDILLVWARGYSERARTSPHRLSTTVLAMKSRCMGFSVQSVSAPLRIEYRFILPEGRI